MAFGRTAKAKVATSAGNAENRTGSIFMDTKQGMRVFRLPHGSEEVRVKRYWLAQNPDGKWEPKFGGPNPNDKRRSIPVVVARMEFDPKRNEARWVGSDRNWRNNPVDRWVQTLEGVDTKQFYAKEEFFLNVIDLTPSRKGADGTVYYPIERGRYPAEAANLPQFIPGDIKLLAGSSGDPSGKSMLANLTRLANNALNDDGEPVDIYDFEIRLVVEGQKLSKTYTFNMGAIRPLPEEYRGLKMYDLSNWPQVWPNAAIEEMMEGAGYLDTIEKYNIRLTPEISEVAAPANGEELFD